METYEIQTPFEPMAQGGQGYEARYRFNEQMEITQYHCHDYYELYIHLHGGEYMGVDNKLYLLKPNQVYIFPPFCMHGLSCTGEMKNYERAFLNLSPEVLENLGCGQLNLNQFLLSETIIDFLHKNIEALPDELTRIGSLKLSGQFSGEHNGAMFARGTIATGIGNADINLHKFSNNQYEGRDHYCSQYLF